MTPESQTITYFSLFNFKINATKWRSLYRKDLNTQPNCCVVLRLQYPSPIDREDTLFKAEESAP